MTEQEAAVEVLARDVFPAEIALPDGQVVTGARAFVTSHRLIAYVVTGDRRIVRAVNLDLTVPGAVEASRNTLVAGQLECPVAGGSAWVNRGRGCGCGSPLNALASPVPWSRR
jgi:hypothetical protein